MITLGRETVVTLNLAVVVTNSSGTAVASDAAPIANFYRVDPGTGTLALDILVGTSGQITMTALSGQVGVYSCPVVCSTLEHPQYQVVVAYAVSAAPHKQILTVLFNSAFDDITTNNPIPLTSTIFASVSE
jgi:hypothetical protein